MSDDKVNGSPLLYRSVRTALIMRGDTLAAWCHRNAINRGFAARALNGERNGPKARELRWHLIEEAGLRS